MENINNFRYMKTRKFIIPILVLLCISCETNRIVTTINPNGTGIREVYAEANSEFLAGDKSHNPYIFHLDENWTVTNLEPKMGDYNVKAGRSFSSMAELSQIQCDNDTIRYLVSPKENFKKQYKWFYTYYNFTAVYSNIHSYITIPIDTFLTKDEQKLWFQGDFTAFGNMNGMELKEIMDDIEQKFNQWYYMNIYEECFTVIQSVDGRSGNSPYYSILPTIKNTLSKNFDTRPEDGIEEVCELLDKHLSTTYYSQLYKNSSLCNTKISLERLIETLFGNELEYELVMPGKLVAANTLLNDTLQWKVNAIRFIADDYILTAQSRTLNTWAIVITLLLGACSVILLLKRKRAI
jgi:hypothetical protein